MRMIRSGVITVSLKSLAVLVLVGGGILRAETATNLINGTTTDVVGPYYVGNNGPFNALIITNSGRLGVTGESVIGNAVAASNNFALVTGSGSAWNSSDNFTIGMTGAFNQLLIANAGIVSNAAGAIGAEAGANNNVVTVTGASSRWVNSGDLVVGVVSCSSNQLLILNGGIVQNVYGTIGSAGRANAVTVSGAGSVWSMSSGLDVGVFNSYNQLTITSGGIVSNTAGYVGYVQGAEVNIATVSGTGSVWNNSGNLYVGFDASYNEMIVTNGGLVRSEKGYIGYGSGAKPTDNAVTVSGAGSVWIMSGNLYVSRAGAWNTLAILDMAAWSATKMALSAAAPKPTVTWSPSAVPARFGTTAVGFLSAVMALSIN